MRGEPAAMNRRTPCGGKQACEQCADECAGFGGNAHVNDFQTQGVSNGANGGGDKAHALRRVEHGGEAPDADECEHETQQAIDNRIESQRLESFRIQMHDRSDHPACERRHQNNAQHVRNALNT